MSKSKPEEKKVVATDTPKVLPADIPGQLKEGYSPEGGLENYVGNQPFKQGIPEVLDAQKRSQLPGMTFVDEPAFIPSFLEGEDKPSDSSEEPALKVDDEATASVEEPVLSHRAGLLYLPFPRFGEALARNAGIDHAGVIRNHRRLLSGFKNLLDVDSPKVFTEAYAAVLDLFHTDPTGAFDSEKSLYRGVDALPVEYEQRQGYTTLLTLTAALADPARRQQNLKQIDLNIALPEIAYFDRRGYLASYARRFA